MQQLAKIIIICGLYHNMPKFSAWILEKRIHAVFQLFDSIIIFFQILAIYFLCHWKASVVTMVNSFNLGNVYNARRAYAPIKQIYFRKFLQPD